MHRTYQELIASDRVSPQTRAVLEARSEPDDPGYQSATLSPSQFVVLRALALRIVPQGEEADTHPIDLAARLDQQLANGNGDGWRYAALPADRDAFAIALSLVDELAQKLSGKPFSQLSAEAQDALITAITAGRISSAKLDLQRWFEDLRAELTRLYVAHPETLARMHYSGIADDPNGFVQLGIGKQEDWESLTQ